MQASSQRDGNPFSSDKGLAKPNFFDPKLQLHKDSPYTNEMRFLQSLPIFAILLSFSSHAKLFRNAYVSFELPPNWNCNLEGTEWVCTNQFEQQSKEAIIILTAKEVGPTDTIAAYQGHLEAPRMINGVDGKPVQSKVISVKQRQIANHLWVDGMHLGSEVTSYYTRYLATIKERIAILVTFSAHKTNYTKYSSDFLKAIESLRVVATKDIFEETPTQKPVSGTIGAPIGTTLPVDLTADQVPPEDSSGLGKSASTWIGLILILAAVLGYLFLKRQKAKKKSKKRSHPPPSNGKK